MEAILLASLIYAHQIPTCPKRFVKLWQDNRAVALQHMPRRCKYRTETGAYICTKQGCQRP